MAETETKGKVFGTPLFIWFILTETTPDLNSQKGPLLFLCAERSDRQQQLEGALLLTYD